MPVTILPSSFTSPSVGASCPRMQLNVVDLPQPLGPMMPRISPSSTWKLTPSTAAMPPKRFLKFVTSRTRLIGAASSGRLALAAARSAEAAFAPRSRR